MANALTDQQLQAIEVLAIGAKNQDAADVAGVSLRTIVQWKSSPLFKAELDRQIEINKKHVDDRLINLADTLILNILDLAKRAKSEKVRLDANVYLLNRLAGMPIAKVENKEVKENDVKNEPTWEDLQKKSIEGNVISIKDSTG